MERLNNVIEKWSTISDDSPFFTHARLEAFRAAYNQYRLDDKDNPKPLQAFIQALPLLQKENGSLITEFAILDEKIKKDFNVEEKGVIDWFDFTLQEVAGGKNFDESRKNLLPEKRFDLLQFGLLRHLKNLLTEEQPQDRKKTKQAISLSSFFKSAAPKDMISLNTVLNQLPEKLDETDEIQKNSIKTCFDDACRALENLSWEKLTKSESTQELETCYGLMKATVNTAIAHTPPPPSKSAFGI